MSSLCAPRHRMRRTPLRWEEITIRERSSGLVVPYSPRSVAAAEHVLQLLPLLVGVHAGPKPVMLVGNQLAGSNQPAKRLLDQFFTFLHIIKQLASEDEITTVHTDAGF